jgi:hypothetical protein
MSPKANKILIVTLPNNMFLNVKGMKFSGLFGEKIIGTVR